MGAEVESDAPKPPGPNITALFNSRARGFALADMVRRSGDRESVRVAGARVIPDGSEATIVLFARPGFLKVALAEHEAKALAKPSTTVRTTAATGAATGRGTGEWASVRWRELRLDPQPRCRASCRAPGLVLLVSIDGLPVEHYGESVVEITYTVFILLGNTVLAFLSAPSG
jgi:hypothetical protein